MLKQGLFQKLQQKLSPQQIQLMKLLQVPTAALEQRIKEELEANPALEEGADEFPEDRNEEDHQDNEDFDSGENTTNDEGPDLDLDDYLNDDDYPYYKTQTQNHGPDEEQRDMPISAGVSFYESLMAQIGLRNLDERAQFLARHMIGNINEDGYLMRDVRSMVDDLAFTQGVETTEEELLDVLEVVQDFDPPGVAARDLRECLLIQLRKRERPTAYTSAAIQILSDYYEEFTKKHYDKISRRMGLDDEGMKAVMREIIHCNPKPGGGQSGGQRMIHTIIPDFLLTNQEGKLELSLNGRNAPELRVSRTYHEMLEQFAHPKKEIDRGQREAVLFVKQKLDAAKWFIDAIRQRQETLMAVMSAMVKFQEAYFLTGDETQLRPMILKDIAEMVGLDISTVSRVANSKYVETPYGTFLLKSFFSESLSTESGEEVSTREVKKILFDCISNESKKKPLTDDRLAEILQAKGYNIARRTVAKYREQLDIPVARLRKSLE